MLSCNLKGQAGTDVPQWRRHHPGPLCLAAAQAQQATAAAGGSARALACRGAAAGSARLAAQHGISLAQLLHHLCLRGARWQLRLDCGIRQASRRRMGGVMGTGRAGVDSAVCTQPAHSEGSFIQTPAAPHPWRPATRPAAWHAAAWAARGRRAGEAQAAGARQVVRTLGVVLLHKLRVLVGRRGALPGGRAVRAEAPQEGERGAAGAAHFLGNVNAVAVAPIRLQAVRVAALPPAGSTARGSSQAGCAHARRGGGGTATTADLASPLPRQL